MSKVIKRNGTFELMPDAGQQALSEAREKHTADTGLLSNTRVESDVLTAILYRVLLRIKALENQIR